MQFGNALSISESFRLMEQAGECGINFLDTAEMYPIPQQERTQGASEEMVGSFLKSKQRLHSGSMNGHFKAQLPPSK